MVPPSQLDQVLLALEILLTVHVEPEQPSHDTAHFVKRLASAQAKHNKVKASIGEMQRQLTGQRTG
jgi:hypothetical protein